MKHNLYRLLNVMFDLKMSSMCEGQAKYWGAAIAIDPLPLMPSISKVKGIKHNRKFYLTIPHADGLQVIMAKDKNEINTIILTKDIK